jgi:hypothetical protein
MQPKDRDAVRAQLAKDLHRERNVTLVQLDQQRSKRGMSPGSLAALARHRKDTQLGGPKMRACKRCRQPAVRTSEFCKSHGGRMVLEKRERDNPKKGVYAPKAARRAVVRLMRSQQLPPGLIDNPTFRAIVQTVAPRSFGLPTVPGLTPPVRAQLALLCREMVLAWLSATEGDFGPWTRALANARKLGF